MTSLPVIVVLWLLSYAVAIGVPFALVFLRVLPVVPAIMAVCVLVLVVRTIIRTKITIHEHPFGRNGD